MSFESFNFDETLLTAIEHAKFTRASKVQKLIIPEVLTIFPIALIVTFSSKVNVSSFCKIVAPKSSNS